MALVSSEIWEKIIRTIYFLNAKSCFVNFNNFCPHQNVIESSNRFLEKKKTHFDSVH